MRYLMLTAIGYTFALIVSHYIIPKGLWLYFAFAFLVIALFALVFKGRVRTLIIILCLSAAVGFAWNRAYSALFIRPAEALVDTERSVVAQVIDMPSVGDGYSTVLLRLKGEDLPSCRVLVTDYDGGFGDLETGDTIRVDLRFRSARLRYNVEDDYYLSSGIFLRAALNGEYELIGTGEGRIIFLPKIIAHSLKAQILEIFPDDVAPLMKALLTGDKREIYEDDGLYVALRLSGLSHIVAVSGMHVSFIISLISLGTGRRRITAFLGIPLVWFFAAMMGFGPSVTRASLMISLALVAPILRRENDPPTSLSSALLILLLINPQSVSSISLQLSFGAMAGIILISPRMYRSMLKLFSGLRGIPARVLKSASSLFSSSVGAMIFTLPLAAIHFGYVPLYSIAANLLCLWAMSLAFMIAYPVAIIGAVCLPLGQALAWVVAWLPRYTIWVIKIIARLPGAALYTCNPLISWWLVYAYVVFLIPYFLKGDRPYRPIIPICSCLVTLALVYLVSAGLSGRANAVTAVDVGQGQCIVATGERSTVVIDCGSRGSAGNAGDTAAEFLLSGGCNKADLLILTHLHDDHANGVVRLMNYMDVERVLLPGDCEQTEIGDSIIQTCYDMGTQLIFIEDNTRVSIDNMSLELLAPIGSADPNESGLIILGDYGDFEFLVTGDAGHSTEEQLVSFYNIGEIDLLVAGHHGSKTSTGEALLEELRPRAAFISVGVNSYGHPTTEVLERLADYGVEVYRTDINGNITMTVGNN